jgi:hypothetical protein
VPGWVGPKKPDEDEVEVLVEVDEVFDWRRKMLQEAGFDRSIAFRLAVNGADWHKAVELLAQGCPQEQILEILL